MATLRHSLCQYFEVFIVCNYDGAVFVANGGNDGIRNTTCEEVPYKADAMATLLKIMADSIINILINDEKHRRGENPHYPARFCRRVRSCAIAASMSAGVSRGYARIIASVS